MSPEFARVRGRTSRDVASPARCRAGEAIPVGPRSDCTGGRAAGRAGLVAGALIAGLAVGVVTGCTIHTTTPLQGAADAGASVVRRPASDPRFAYERGQIQFENHVLGTGATPEYSLRELVVPSIADNGQRDGNLTARYYRSEEPGPRPLVIVLPIFARYTYPSNKMSTFLQKHSRGQFHVLDVRGESFLFDWRGLSETADPAEFMKLIREGVERERTVVVDIRRLVDWAEQQPEIDGSRVALVGFSRSAIVAGLAATQEPRLAATVLLMGGAHPHEIFARCVGKRTSAVQSNVNRQLGWDQSELEERIRGAFAAVDAANYPGRVDPAGVLIFEASRDSCIQESSRRALREAMGWPETVSLAYGHRIAFAGITPLGGNWICRRTWEFLQERLLAERSPS